MTIALDGERNEGHTLKALDQALSDLRLNVLSMGGLAIDQVSSASKALLENNPELARVVVEREQRVNDFDRSIDREAFQLIALRQPVAGDLRTAKAISRVAVELERVADEAKKIARFAVRLSQGEPMGPMLAVVRHLRHMSELSVSMLRSAVRALDEGDAELARTVTARDEEIDTEFEAALRQLLTLVMQDQLFLKATIDTVFALKSLERIGDHAKNIGEQVLFMMAEEEVSRS
jgi:phosphate transport system protein